MTSSIELLDQQRALLHAVVHAVAHDAAAHVLLRTPPGGEAPRLFIYRHAYRARLRGALADNYTVLQRALGDDGFDALAEAYIDAHPSARPSIRWFGDQLPAFMDERGDLVPHPALADIARMDWALRSAFDAADAPVLDLGVLATIAPERWAELRLAAHPSVQLLPLNWTVEAAWRALRAYEPESDTPEPELPEPDAQPHALLVWRRELETQWRSLPALESRLLQAALAGASFAQWCAVAADALNGDETQAAQATAGALQQWLHDGLFSTIA